MHTVSAQMTLLPMNSGDVGFETMVLNARNAMTA
jgi:hypothetical protein